MVQRGRSLTSWLHRGRTGPAVFRATAVGQSRSGRCNSICRPIVPANPALAVRGPKHVVKTGTTPVLDNAEWRKLLDSIPTTTVRDLRDCALIATQTYSFARVTAAPKMKVEDLRPRGAGWTIRLHEKGGKASNSGVSSRACRSAACVHQGGRHHRGPQGLSVPYVERTQPAMHYAANETGKLPFTS